MVRRELIFFGTLIGWMLCILLGIWVFPTFLKNMGQLWSLVPILTMVGLIFPRYFSKRYNNWLETDPFKKKENG